MVSTSEQLNGASLLRFSPFWFHDKAAAENYGVGNHREDTNHSGRDQQNPPEHHSSPREPSPELPDQSMRAMFDEFISPLISCVHQPYLSSCVAVTCSNCHSCTSSTSWDNKDFSLREILQRERSISSPFPSTKSLSPERCNANRSLLRIVEPGENDVVCGRGANTVPHEGNQKFRDLISANRSTYAGLTKKQKMNMARQIVDVIHTANPPGRFLSRDHRTGLWEDVGLPRSLEKAAQALREKPTDSDSETEPQAPIRSGSSNSSTGTNKSSRNPPPVPIEIPPHLRSVFRLAPSTAWAPEWPLSPQMQSPALIETSSSSSSIHDSRPHHLYPPFPNSLEPMSVTPRSSYQPSHTSTPSSAYSLPSSSRSPFLPTFLEDPEPTQIELTYSSSSISITTSSNSDKQGIGDSWKRPRLVLEEAETATTATAATTVTSFGSSLPLSERIVGRQRGGGGGLVGQPYPILPSPSALLQSRHHHRIPFRHRSPSQVQRQRNKYADSMDGLTAAALSTAAFLRLDDSD